MGMEARRGAGGVWRIEASGEEVSSSCEVRVAGRSDEPLAGTSTRCGAVVQSVLALAPAARPLPAIAFAASGQPPESGAEPAGGRWTR